MWKQIKALILLVFFMFFVFNSFFYTPPNRNYTKLEVEERNKQEREKKYANNNTSINDNNQSMIQNQSMNETVSEEQIDDLQFEFPSNDNGEKIYSEEELQDKAEREIIFEDIIESDAEKNTKCNKVEEYDYYYEYIYEEMNIVEENLNIFEDSQDDFIEQIIQLDEDQQELSHNESSLNFNITQDTYQSVEVQNELSEDPNEFNQYSNQTKTERVEGSKEGEKLQKQEEYHSILEEEEISIFEENYKQSQTISNDIKKDEQIVADPITSEFNTMNNTINQEQQQSQQTIYINQQKYSQQKQNSNQFFNLYFEQICFKDQYTIEQREVIPSSLKGSEISITDKEINPILLVHTIILTLLLIFISINDKQSIKIKKELIQETTISQLSELNEYMTMMIDRLEQQYNLISQSQEQLACQLELLEQ